MNKSIKSVIVVPKHIFSEQLFCFLQIFNCEKEHCVSTLVAEGNLVYVMSQNSQLRNVTDPQRFEFRWGRRISLFQKLRPWGPPSLLFNGYRGSLAGEKQPSVCVWRGEGKFKRCPPSSARVTNEWSYTSTSLTGLHGQGQLFLHRFVS